MLARCKSKAGIPGAFSRFWTSAETPGNCRCGVPVQAMMAPSLSAVIPASCKHAVRRALGQVANRFLRRHHAPRLDAAHAHNPFRGDLNSAASVSLVSTPAGRKCPNPASADIYAAPWLLR